MNLMKEVAKEVSRDLKSRNLKHRDIAEFVGIPVSSVAQLLAGTRPFSMPVALKFTRSFGYSVDYLLYGVGKLKCLRDFVYKKSNEPFQVCDFMGNYIYNGSLVISDFSTDGNSCIYIFLWEDGVTPGVFSLYDGFVPVDIDAENPILTDYFLCDGINFCRLLNDSVGVFTPNGTFIDLSQVESLNLQEAGLGLNCTGLSIDIKNLFTSSMNEFNGYPRIYKYKNKRCVLQSSSLIKLTDGREFGLYEYRIEGTIKYFLLEKTSRKVFGNIIFRDFPELLKLEDKNKVEHEVITDYFSHYDIDGKKLNPQLSEELNWFKI